MKNYKMMALALVMTAGASLNASENAQKPQVVAQAAQKAEAVATKLSAEEQAFAAKLSDQNRKAFADKFSAEQRKAAMAAAKTSTVANAADEAVAKMVGSCGGCTSEAAEKAPVAVSEVPAEAHAPAKAK